MPTAAEFVAVANSQVGYTESPSGSNMTKYGEWYGDNPAPWCDMFVSWCAAEIGAASLVGHFSACRYHAKWFQAMGQWVEPSEEPRPGDVVFFAKYGTPQHVGIVRGTDSAGRVLTIEGNTSQTSDDNGGAVMLRVRTPGDPSGAWGICGYGRPLWDSEGFEDMTDAEMRQFARIVADYVNGYEDRYGSSLINEIANAKARADSNGKRLAALEDAVQEMADALQELADKIL